MADNQFESYESDAEASNSGVHKVSDVDDHVCIENYPCKGLEGISILEVYSITYLGSSPMEPEDQIGKISVKTNDDIIHYLYYEHKVDTSKPSIKYGDQIPMWDVEPVCSFTNLELKFDRFSDRYEGSTKKFSYSRKDGDLLAKLSLKSLHGYERKISVLFGCFSNATVANLMVMFSPHDPISDATTNVYGVVMASNSKFDHPSCTSYLFSRNPTSTIQVGHNEVIPLSKSRVGVPLDSQLYVDISLFCDGSQYKGSANFTPNINNTKESKTIGDRILVEVTWNCNEESYSTDDDSDYTDECSNSMDEFDSASECEFDSEGDIQKEILETVT